MRNQKVKANQYKKVLNTVSMIFTIYKAVKLD